MDATLLSGDAVVIDARQLQRRLEAVPDPELPWVTISDLGVLRRAVVEEARVVVEVTPTWSGCPAMDAIRESIRLVLDGAGYKPEQVEINTSFSPAWTTDDITDAGRRKLARAGIAPPRKPAEKPLGDTVCPLCQSSRVREVSEFGSTPCKALMACRSCLEPFDRFKEL